MMFFFLFPLVIVLSLYDLKCRRIPNWITLPLMLVGFFASFPGNPILWIASAMIFSAWKSGFMGGGDAKLWIGLLWCLYSFTQNTVILMFATLMVTAIAQLLVRFLSTKKLSVGFRTAGAWRAVVFMGLVAYFS
jgi:Flp pilus assembly protein protease CpaA